MGRVEDGYSADAFRSRLRDRPQRQHRFPQAYPSEAAAKDGLAQFASRGVRTARVVQERAELRGQWLRLPQADASLKQRLDNLKTALAGKALRPCQKPSTPTATPS